MPKKEKNYKQIKAYLRPAAPHSSEESGVVDGCLIHGPARRQVVARGKNTNSIRGARNFSMQDLSPQLSGMGPGGRHETKRKLPFWHHGETVHDGPEMGVPDNQNKLQQQRKFL